jgi:hypothetical protein
MSQENVELSRAFLGELARAGQEGLDPDATVSKMAEFWDPEIESDASESEVPGLSGIYRGSRPFGSSGETV